MYTGADYYNKIQKIPPIPSGDPVLDDILKGGFRKGPIHLLYGPKKILASILMRAAVNFFITTKKFTQDSSQIVYVDGENLFNPYLVSKLAVSNHLGPSFVLDRIMVARTFTWSQMVETLEENLHDLELSRVHMILVSGLTAMFDSSSDAVVKTQQNSSSASRINLKAFQDLKRIFSGLNRATAETQPTIVLTGPLHPKSQYRPVGGRLLSHFAGIIVGIHDHPRYIDYTLDQHLFLGNTRIRSWKTPEKGVQKSQYVSNQRNSLDNYLRGRKS